MNLLIEDGTFNIESANDGLKGVTSVKVTGGTLTL